MFGGCIPMLIQWPLLFGFYRMLANVIELRHAHWLWLHDLSAPDPLYLLPIFVIVSMFLVQWPHAIARNGPGTAADDGLHHAGRLRIHDVELSGRACHSTGRAATSRMGQQILINRTSMGREMREIAAQTSRQKENGKLVNARK